MEKETWNDYIVHLENKLYNINSNISVNLMKEFDPKRKMDLSEINDRITQLIKLVRRCKE